MSVDKVNVSVFYGGVNHSWSDAVSDGVVIGYLYDWDESGQSYVFSDVLVPGEGYWVYAYYECVLKREVV